MSLAVMVVADMVEPHFNDPFIANFLEIVKVKEFCKNLP